MTEHLVFASHLLTNLYHLLMRKLLFESLGQPTHCPHMHVTHLTNKNPSIPHSHDFYEVFLVTEGQGVHHLNRQKTLLRPGHLEVVSPKDAHCYSTAAAGGLVFFNLAVSTPWWQAWHTLMGLPEWVGRRRSVVLTPAETQRLAADLGAVGLGKNPMETTRLWGQIKEFVTAKATPRENQKCPDWLEAVRLELAAMPQALPEPIAYWQRRSGRSPEHLARSCRRFYGITFSELINRARIERAQFLLRTTDEKVTTIAYDCGFENLAHFYRVFARLTGHTPGIWRKAGAVAVPVRALGASKAEAEPLWIEEHANRKI